MGFRFRKSIKLLPGVRVNLGTKGASLSVGRRGATVNIGKTGVRTTVGLPGTGLSYSSHRRWENGADATRGRPTSRPPQKEYGTGEMLASLAIIAAMVLFFGLLWRAWVLWAGIPVVAFFTWAVLTDARSKAERAALLARAPVVPPPTNGSSVNRYPPAPQGTARGGSLPPAAARKIVPLLAERSRIVTIAFTEEGLRRVREIDAEVSRIATDAADRPWLYSP